MKTAVVTCLLTKHGDPNKAGKRWPADPDTLTVRHSIRAHGRRTVVLHDELDAEDDDHTEYVKVADTSITNPYFARWRHIADWLDNGADVDMVWCVDGTDVTMLNDPFPYMHEGPLYIGSEPAPTDGRNPRSLGFWWLRSLHPDHGEWIDEQPNRVLLNCGVVGGHRRTVRHFARAVARHAGGDDLTDMAAANRVAYSTPWVGWVVTGDTVTTPMWSGATSSPYAWWAHK